ncbi:zeta toxin family protein [Sphingomonas sp. HH69]
MPLVTMIGGPNGSGKSTLIKLLRDAGADLGLHFNADENAKTLTGETRDVSQRAQAMVRQSRDEALRQGFDYSWETVMSHPSHVEHLQEAKMRGYKVRMIYVALTSPYANMARVEERAGRRT